MPWELCSDDLVVIAEIEDVIKKLHVWKDSVKNGGMRNGPDFELDGIHLGSWYHCSPISICH